MDLSIRHGNNLEFSQDIQELKQIPEASQLQESKAAKRLTKRVDKMLKSMEKLMGDLEKQKSELKTEIKENKEQLQQLKKTDDTDTRKMLDMVDRMDQKKYNSRTKYDREKVFFDERLCSLTLLLFLARLEILVLRIRCFFSGMMWLVFST